MRYNDGIPMGEDMRVTRCPRCENEEFDDEADFCRICGLSRFNRCEGFENDSGYQSEVVYHNNYGNARYCERCGMRTTFLLEGFLKPFENINGKTDSIDPFAASASAQQIDHPLQKLADDDGELPF